MFFNPNKTILCYTQKFISLILILQCSIFSVSGQNNAVYNTENTNLSIPVLFVENVGQLEDMNGQPVPNVLFTAQLPDLQVFITTSGITFLTLEKKSPIEHYLIDRKVQWERIEMLLDGAHIKAQNIVKTVSGITQYHIYNSQKPDGVHSSPITKILIKEIYPGIDWEIYNSDEKGFKYNFIVHPFADPDIIKIKYNSGDKIVLNQSGQIELFSKHGNLSENKPISFTQTGDVIETSFLRINAGNNFNELEVKFLIGDYDKSKQLIIDPELHWCTYYGGAMEECFNSVTTDLDGNLFLTGWTDSPNFPVSDAGTFYQGVKSADEEAVILKFSPAHVLIWATFYGGNHEDWGHSITTDNAGNVFVAGETVSNTFPTYNAGTYYDGTLGSDEDVFILKFDNDGNRLWATFYGGSKKEGGYSICTDPTGNIFVTGYTDSNDFPKLNAGTYYQAAMAGIEDLFILKFDNAGNRLWATYCGGSLFDNGYAITSDIIGNIFITGITRSINFPTYDAGTYYQPAMAGDTDIVILKFANNGTRLWSTYYGGTLADYGNSIITDIFDNIFISGYTESTNFPVQDNGTFFQSLNGGQTDACLLKFDNSGNRIWSTYIGGTGKENMFKWDGLAMDICNNIYTTFTTFSSAMPLLDAGCSSYYDGTYAGFGDLFISRFTNDGIQTWATYFGFEDEDLNSCIGIDNLDGKSLYMTGQYNEYDPGEAVPLVNPGGGAYYDGSHNGDDEAFIAQFIPVPLDITTNNSNICACLDTAIALPDCGIAPYTFLWSDGQTTQTAFNLCAGIYTVTVTDADCSIDSATIEIICLLPVTLETFYGENRDLTNTLFWTTASENNSALFIVEKMGEDGKFVPIGEITAAGNSTELMQYTFVDDMPSSGNNYYRLNQMDLNGNTKYSDIINVTVETPDQVVIYPNPFQENINIDIINSNLSNLYSVQIFDLSANLLINAELSSTNTNKLNLSNLNSGTYLMRVFSDKNLIYSSVIIKDL